jgi:hypothetical protein
VAGTPGSMTLRDGAVRYRPTPNRVDDRVPPEGVRPGVARISTEYQFEREAADSQQISCDFASRVRTRANNPKVRTASFNTPVAWPTWMLW